MHVSPATDKAWARASFEKGDSTKAAAPVDFESGRQPSGAVITSMVRTPGGPGSAASYLGVSYL